MSRGLENRFQRPVFLYFTFLVSAFIYKKRVILEQLHTDSGVKTRLIIHYGVLEWIKTQWETYEVTDIQLRSHVLQTWL